MFGAATLVLSAAAVGRADSQPRAIPACSVLSAERAAPSGKLDTARIQTALSLCAPGRAVVLRGDGARRVFESAPLILPRGVTLFVGEGVTLYASRNPRDYDLPPRRCGEEPPGKAAVCKPFVFAYQAAFSGVAGPGTIDGQGAPWWNLPRQARALASTVAVPDLVSSYESQGFRLDGITLRNAAGMHAAIYKTIGLAVSNLKIASPASAGLLLSNAVDARINGAWIRVAGEAIGVEASILGASAGLSLRDVHVFGGRGIRIGGAAYGDVHGMEIADVTVDGAAAGFEMKLAAADGLVPRDIRFGKTCFRDVADALRVTPAGREADFRVPPAANCVYPAFGAAPKLDLTADLGSAMRFGTKENLVVSPDGASGFRSVQSAVDALPATGGEILIKPGTYREVVTIRKPKVRLHGEGNPTIVFGNGAPTSGGTFNTATVFVEADGVEIDTLTIANDFGIGKGQAVALAVTGDRAMFRQLRLLGAQDTLFAASRYCYGDYGPCVPARQYFADSYIEGNVDFIFGDSQAVFERCRIHGIAPGNVMYTAQSRHTAEQKASGYVFDHCRLTAAARQRGVISLGRPRRPYATVVWLHTVIEAPVIPAGWTEWARFGKPSLPTAYYAEYASTGAGANLQRREPYSHQLSAAEAEKWAPGPFLAGKDGWNPGAARRR